MAEVAHQHLNKQQKDHHSQINLSEEAKKNICEQIKYINKDINYFIIRTTNDEHRAPSNKLVNRKDFESYCSDSKPTFGLRAYTVEQIKHSAMFLMIFNEKTGLLNFDLMRTYYQSDYRGEIAPYAGSNAPVKLNREGGPGKPMTINVNETFFTKHKRKTQRII